MQDREDGAVRRRIQELVRVPARGQWPGLGLAVADDAGDEQLRVVERGAVGVAERVSELAALVDRAGRLGRGVAGHATGERELPEELLHADRIARDRRPALRVRPLEPRARAQGRPAVARPGDEEGIDVVGADQPVDVRVQQVQSGSRPPVPEQAGLHVLGRQRLAQQGIGEQVDLADGEVVGRPPPGIDASELVCAERTRRRAVDRAVHGAPAFSARTAIRRPRPCGHLTTRRSPGPGSDSSQVCSGRVRHGVPHDGHGNLGALDERVRDAAEQRP